MTPYLLGGPLDYRALYSNGTISPWWPTGLLCTLQQWHHTSLVAHWTTVHSTAMAPYLLGGPLDYCALYSNGTIPPWWPTGLPCTLQQWHHTSLVAHWTTVHSTAMAPYLLGGPLDYCALYSNGTIPPWWPTGLLCTLQQWHRTSLVAHWTTVHSTAMAPYLLGGPLDYCALYSNGTVLPWWPTGLPCTLQQWHHTSLVAHWTTVHSTAMAPYFLGGPLDYRALYSNGTVPPWWPTGLLCTLQQWHRTSLVAHWTTMHSTAMAPYLLGGPLDYRALYSNGTVPPWWAHWTTVHSTAMAPYLLGGPTGLPCTLQQWHRTSYWTTVHSTEVAPYLLGGPLDYRVLYSSGTVPPWWPTGLPCTLQQWHCTSLVAHWTTVYSTAVAPYLLGGPLEAGHNTVLDLVQVLHSLGAVHQQVGPGALWPKAPDLPGFCEVPLVLVSEVASPGLGLLPWCDGTLFRTEGWGGEEGGREGGVARPYSGCGIKSWWLNNF